MLLPPLEGCLGWLVGGSCCCQLPLPLPLLAVLPVRSRRLSPDAQCLAGGDTTPPRQSLRLCCLPEPATAAVPSGEDARATSCAVATAAAAASTAAVATHGAARHVGTLTVSAAATGRGVAAVIAAAAARRACRSTAAARSPEPKDPTVGRCEDLPPHVLGLSILAGRCLRGG